jgi:hypothetical protein
MTAPREIGIPFGIPMVQAILRPVAPKTMTRRVAKRNACGRVQRGHRNWHVDDPEAVLACPYGQPGDRLYVREPWRTEARYDHLSPAALPADARIWYLADGEPAEPGAGRYRHARFMPRRFARIVLEVTGRKLERLQAISEADAKAEGARKGQLDDLEPPNHWRGFKWLWESINGPGSWEANPLVWAVSFTRITP